MKPALLICLVYFIPLTLLASSPSRDGPLSLLRINSSYIDNDESSKVEALLVEAWTYKHIDQVKALKRVAEARELALETNSVEEEAKADYINALLQLSYGNKLEAKLLFSKSLEKIAPLGKEKDYAIILANRAKLNLDLNDIYAAEQDFEQLYRLAENADDLLSRAIVLNSQGKVAEAKHDFSEALGKYTQAFRISKSIGDEKTNAESLVLLGACYLKIGDTVLGVENLTKALAIKQKNGDDKEAEALIMLQLARAFALDDDTKALKLAKKSLALAKVIKNVDIKLNAYEVMGDIQANRKNYEEAYHLKSLINQILLERKGTAKSIDFLVMDTAGTDNKESTIIFSEKLSYLKRAQAITIAIFLFVLGCFCIRMFRTHEETNKMLNQKNEELKISKSALEKFTYAASHDLKEPLRTIGSFSSLIGNRYAGKLGKEGGEYIDFITRGVDQMYNLLDDIRIYSSLFQDNNIAPRQVDLKEILSAVKLCAAESPETGKVKIGIPANLPTIMGNPVQMHHLFLNLVNNAIQHNDKAFPVVQIKCEEIKNFLLFKVIDNGNGIAEKYHEKIFHAFKRLSRKQKPGSGVGLAVCKKIVEKHHGSIWLDSKVGEGTTFSFTLPRAQIKRVPIFRRFRSHFNKSA